jgi:SAM-dependent methyltransferase
MTSDASTSALRNTWESAAPGWAKWEPVLADPFSDATDVLLDMAAVEPGMRVLDLACGAGSQSIQAARRVGPHGTGVATAISATMLEHTRRTAAAAAIDTIETRECAADDLAAARPPFEAAICRMGLMLFPSPRSVVEAVRGALKPGARFAALVFAPPSGNPFLAQPMAILLRHAGKAPPGPGQPGLFALGGPGVLAGVLRDGGLEKDETRTVRVPLAFPDAATAALFLQEAAGAYRAVVAGLDETARSAAWDEVREHLGRLETAGGLETELEVIIGSGRRPG